MTGVVAGASEGADAGEAILTEILHILKLVVTLRIIHVVSAWFKCGGKKSVPSCHNPFTLSVM